MVLGPITTSGKDLGTPVTPRDEPGTLALSHQRVGAIPLLVARLQVVTWGMGAPLGDMLLNSMQKTPDDLSLCVM